jgi:hypothetical protein
MLAGLDPAFDIVYAVMDRMGFLLACCFACIAFRIKKIAQFQ